MYEGYDQTLSDDEVQWNMLDGSVRRQFIERTRLRKMGNPEAEQALLGAILANNTALHHCGQMKPEYFVVDVHQRIFAEVQALIAAGVRADPIMLKHKFEEEDALADAGGWQYLVRLAGAALSVVSVSDYAQLIYDLYLRRKMAGILERMLNRMADAKEGNDAEVLRADAMSKLLDASEGFGARRIKQWDVVGEQVMQNTVGGGRCFSTGLRSLDELLAGGLYLGKSVCFLARMKRGKTTLMSTIYTNLAVEFRRLVESGEWQPSEGWTTPPTTLYICAEMGENEIHQRITARLMGRNSSVFYHGMTNDFRMALSDHLVASRGYPAHYYDAPGLRFEELRQMCMIAVKKHGCKVIFLDWLGLVRGWTPTTKVQFFEEVCEWIANFAKDQHIAFVYANQLNRQGESRNGDGPNISADALIELEKDDDTHLAWLTAKAIRYTYDNRAGGTAQNPTLEMVKEGPHFADYEAPAALFSCA